MKSENFGRGKKTTIRYINLQLFQVETTKYDPSSSEKQVSTSVAKQQQHTYITYVAAVLSHSCLLMFLLDEREYVVLTQNNSEFFADDGIY